MSAPPAGRRRAAAAAAAAVLAYAAVLYVLWLRDETFRLAVLRGTAMACQGTAATLGSWGLEAERSYHRLIEAGRTI